MPDHSYAAIAAGETAIVTGGASGIGLAAARALAALDMRVVVVDRPGVDLGELERSIDNVSTANVDVTDACEMARLADEIHDRRGRVSFLMNNAGIGGGGDVLTDVGRWNEVIGVNLMGMLHGLQAFVPAMIRSGHPGLVVNTGSKQGITQPPGDTAYNVSKAGVKALTEGLAHTLREKTKGVVTAHLLIPGFTWTGMTAGDAKDKPAAAWAPEQVVDFMLDGLRDGDFYLLCPDGETTPSMDLARISWAAGDLLENRPALSRWHPDYADAFASHMECSS